MRVLYKRALGEGKTLFLIEDDWGCWQEQIMYEGTASTASSTAASA